MQDLIMAAYLFYFLVQGGGQLQMYDGQLQMYSDPQSRPSYLDTLCRSSNQLQLAGRCGNTLGKRQVSVV